MKQLNSIIASALVSGLIVVGMVGIGANALTTPGAPANNAPAQVTLNSNASASQQLRQRTTSRSTGGNTDGTFASTE